MSHQPTVQADWNTYVARLGPAIAMLREMMRLKGVEMSEIEAWQYLSWCAETCQTSILRMADSDEYSEVYGTVATLVSFVCQNKFVAIKTGSFPPPVGRTRYDGPDGLVKKKQATLQMESQLRDHAGYL